MFQGFLAFWSTSFVGDKHSPAPNHLGPAYIGLFGKFLKVHALSHFHIFWALIINQWCDGVTGLSDMVTLQGGSKARLL